MDQYIGTGYPHTYITETSVMKDHYPSKSPRHRHTIRFAAFAFGSLQPVSSNDFSRDLTNNTDEWLKSAYRSESHSATFKDEEAKHRIIPSPDL